MGKLSNINNTDFSDIEYPIHPPTPSRREKRRKGEEDRMRWMDYYREQIKENIDYGSDVKILYKFDDSDPYSAEPEIVKSF